MKTLCILMLPLLFVSCGKNGKNGVAGPKGDQGIQGEKGDKGDDAKVKVIKLCAGLTDAYGVAYQERGLCVNGVPHAIYSSNNLAALVELSYGTYVTTTPKGTNCTFIVNEDTCKE